MSVQRPGTLSGAQRVAVILMQLDQEHAAEVMKQFTDDEAEAITAEILAMQRVDSFIAESAVDEFYDLTTEGRRLSRGGREVAVGLLEASYGVERAAGVLDRVASTLNGRSFEFLEQAEASHLRTLLDAELPQTIALVLTHLRPDLASAVLAGLEDDARADVVQCIATMGAATPEAVAIVADSLRSRIAAVITPREAVSVTGGVQPLVDILNRADATTERAMLEALEARDPVLAEEVRARMVTFEDLLRLTNRDVQAVLRGIEPPVLALALRAASERITETIRGNISERQKELVDDEIGLLGQVRLSQVEEARATIVTAMRTMDAEGVISLQFEDEEADDYV